MKLYAFQSAQQIVAGRGSLEELPARIAHMEGINKAFIVAQPSASQLGYLDAVVNGLQRVGIASEWNTDIEPEPTDANIYDVFKAVERSGCDAIIGIGGGSVLDAAKLLSVMLTNEQSIEDMTGIEKIRHEGVPTVLIPTTAGTGSEVTPNAIVTFPEKELKIGVVSRHLLPKLVILDPLLTVSLPRPITASTGMDAYTHAIESYISNKANPISDMFALESIRLISANLTEAYRDGDNLDAREGMLVGAMYGGMALTSAGTAAVHAMAYPIGGKFNVPHGVANSMLLPHVMRFNLDAVTERLAKVAAAMGVAGTTEPAASAAERVVAKIEEWTKELDIPQDLAAFGVKSEDVPALAVAASQVTRLMDNNPKPMNLTDIERIYRRLLLREN